VEAVLVLPFLLVLVVLSVYSTKLMLLKKDSQTESRLTAWRHVTLSAVCWSLPRQLSHGDLLSRYCSTNDSPAQQFLDKTAHGQHAEHKRQMVQITRQASVPGAVTATTRASRAFGRPEAPAQYWTRLHLDERHGVDAMTRWQRQDLPIGYDRYLKRVLDSDTIFPHYFPKAR
jgi:hypothetical protein